MCPIIGRFKRSLVISWNYNFIIDYICVELYFKSAFLYVILLILTSVLWTGQMLLKFYRWEIQGLLQARRPSQRWCWFLTLLSKCGPLLPNWILFSWRFSKTFGEIIMLTTLIRDQLIRKTGDRRKVNYINKAQNPVIRKFFRICFAYLYFVYFVILLYKVSV